MKKLNLFLISFIVILSLILPVDAQFEFDDIKISPEEAVSKTDIENVESIEILIGLQDTNKISKDVVGSTIPFQSSTYLIKGTKKERLLFLIPITTYIETKVNAENGNIISIKKPFWSFLIF